MSSSQESGKRPYQWLPVAGMNITGPFLRLRPAPGMDAFGGTGFQPGLGRK
jgi:hypothetical protein